MAKDTFARRGGRGRSGWDVEIKGTAQDKIRQERGASWRYCPCGGGYFT
ncbi:MAG: hypothetical protein IPJ13_27995 [Saprospiraceae bacterium]|nr:hypothetical protein [Saprospiraceae bacterium]